MDPAIIAAVIGAVVTILTPLVVFFVRRRSKDFEISSLATKDLGVLDVKVRNTGSSDALITEIEVLIVKDLDLEARAVLPPSAGYKIPIGDLKRGQSKSIQVSHVVEASKADRFLVALDTTRVLKVKLALTYNRDKTASRTVWLRPEKK